MPNLIKEYEIKAGDFIRAGDGSIQVQSTLKSIGFDPTILRRASVCAYESEMNVVMYGGDGTLSLTVDTNEIIIEVKDNGPGILKDVQDKVFIPFFTTKPSGSGIGLSLSKQILRLHNANIKVHSQPDIETIFTMTF